jgi:hypothetical protein
VPIFGPYDGQLSNNGERLELIQPDIPDGSYIPQVLVEAVEFRDSIPWPGTATDGAGASMQRRPTGGVSTLNPIPYANEPLSWIAGNPTPGALNGGPISPLPVITAQPQSRTNSAGSAATLSVTASGANLTYQWRVNPIDESGQPAFARPRNIPGATNASLTIAPVDLEHDGFYDVIVSTGGGSVFSAVARLTVTAPPYIVAAPFDIEARSGSNVVFSVTAVGPGPLTYQWRYNGTNIPGATSRTLLLPNVQLEQSGRYEVIVSNPNDTASAVANLNVLVTPVFLFHPQTIHAFVGETVQFRTATYGTQPMGYRWRRNAINFVPLGTPVLTVTNVQLTNSGYFFDVIVTNRATAGSAGVLSQRAYLFVYTDNDSDRMGDSWEISSGLNPGVADATLDTDGDGMTNLEEFIAGTEPTNSLSYLSIDHLSVGAQTTLEFMANSNRNYGVQFSDNFGAGAWFNLTNAFTRPTNRLERVVDPDAGPRRYYRLVTPQQP